MTISDDLAALTLLLSAVAAVWALIAWFGRPRFIVGIPPSNEEQTRNPELRGRLGELSVVSGFRHRPDCFARVFRDVPWMTLDQRARYMNDRRRAREVRVGADGLVRIAAVFENYGRRMAKDFTASISFLPDPNDATVQITDVAAEDLDLTGIYSEHPDLLAEHLRGRATAPQIVAAYDNYLPPHAPTWGDAIFLCGTLESRMYVLVSVTVRPAAQTQSFLVLFGLDCSDGWLRAQTRMQGVRLDRSSLGEVSSF